MGPSASEDGAQVEPGDETDDEDSGTSRLEGDLLDLEPLLRDSVVLSLPFQPLCRDDCPGLCSECGVHLADDPGHRHEAVDPRGIGEAHVGAHDRPLVHRRGRRAGARWRADRSQTLPSR